MADDRKTLTISKEPVNKYKPGYAVLAMGVFLPLITLGVELTTHMCAEAIFDPLPTLIHVIAVALVPIANMAVWRELRRGNASAKIARFNSLVIGIALFYSVMFLPLVPIGAVAVIYFGLGLLPLTPLLSLLASIRLRVLLSRHFRGAQVRAPLWPGMIAGVLVLIAIELPATLTRIGMEMATADTHEVRLTGLKWLRTVGSEEVLLRYCYPRSGRGTDMVGALFMRSFSVQQAQELYYRVTGTAFNSVPVSSSRSAAPFPFGSDWDRDQGSDRVGGRLRDLTLASSRMDGTLDANAAIGYLEWTMVFHNDGNVAKEARAQISLPSEAVVSRVTLWIDGEEREAAFAGRGKVREAYENVVRQNRDPVLVTSAGKDRVSMQLFPVPSAGEMKVRLGITVPMRLQGENEGLMALPYFHERNFELAPALHHALWMESKSLLRSGKISGTAIPDGYSLRTELVDSQLAERTSAITAERGTKKLVWAPDPGAPGFIVRQHFISQAITPPKRLVVIVDGSVSMRDAAPQLAAALANLPITVQLSLMFAGETMNEQTGQEALTATSLAEKIEDFAYAGGQDNVSQLARGLDLLSGHEDALLWIHGPQPVSLGDIEPLLQRLERLSFQPVWYEVQVQPGSNRVGEKLEGLITPAMLSIEDLHSLTSDWRSGGKRLVAQRERLVLGSGTQEPSGKTSRHLVRLWAADEIERLVQQHKPKKRDLAIRIAQTYQLVTPVSGAVVLETQEQYDRAGLNPVDAGTVPTVPEPEVWALLIIAFIILLHTYVRHRATRGPHVIA